DTFDSGNGNMDFKDIAIKGVLKASGAQTISVNGSWDASSGSFQAANSVVVFTATTSGHTIRANGSPFHGLTFNGLGGQWTIYGRATSTATTTIAAGNLVQGGNSNLEVRSLVIENGAAFTKASGTGILIFESPEDGYFEEKNAVKTD
ncbi:hypothetical protein LCT53_24350, partial [Escherichia coli]|uniref:hypothetical protein n=1 Tax=Escherichia coli TaxID=562 RepID=UPI001EFD5A80|nr:hypothetical protein [Escherichia coli]